MSSSSCFDFSSWLEGYSSLVPCFLWHSSTMTGKSWLKKKINRRNYWKIRVEIIQKSKLFKGWYYLSKYVISKSQLNICGEFLQYWLSSWSCGGDFFSWLGFQFYIPCLYLPRTRLQLGQECVTSCQPFMQKGIRQQGQQPMQQRTQATIFYEKDHLDFISNLIFYILCSILSLTWKVPVPALTTVVTVELQLVHVVVTGCLPKLGGILMSSWSCGDDFSSWLEGYSSLAPFFLRHSSTMTGKSWLKKTLSVFLESWYKTNQSPTLQELSRKARTTCSLSSPFTFQRRSMLRKAGIAMTKVGFIYTFWISLSSTSSTLEWLLTLKVSYFRNVFFVSSILP